MIIVGVVCLFAGTTIGWVLFRSERAYQEGWRDGERHGRAEGFKEAIYKFSRHNLLNPQTGDWYEK